MIILNLLCFVLLILEKNIHFKRPGEVHKARWLGKLLYAIKISLLEARITELRQGTITIGVQLTKLERCVLFATLIYNVRWFTSSCTVDAPYKDLRLC